MEKLDQIKKPIDIQTQLKMTLISMKGKKERRRSRELTSIEKKYEDGKFKSKSLLRFSKPKEVKGTGFLTWDKVGSNPDDQWLYLPALKKVKRIRTKEKGRSFMGTDFSYEDLSGETWTQMNMNFWARNPSMAHPAIRWRQSRKKKEGSTVPESCGWKNIIHS